MSVEWISTVGAGCAFLLAVAYGITSRRGVVLMVAGIILLWLPDLTRTLTVEMATEKIRIEQHESSRAKRHAGGS
jgi:sugar/nucleoside kinase (ribokinase family)